MKPQHKGQKIFIQEVHITEIKDDVGPPPPHLKSIFKNLQDWLSNICDSEKPQKQISNYSLGLFESDGDYVLYLVGFNKYDNHEKIDFEPLNMYLSLSKVEYNNLSREQLVVKLTSQLRDFTKTEKFKSSFLSNSNSIALSGK